MSCAYHDICPECRKVRAHTRSIPPYKCPRCKRIEELEQENTELSQKNAALTHNMEAAAKAILDLEQDREKLYALEGAGVDNWEGYEIAMESLEE